MIPSTQTEAKALGPIDMHRLYWRMLAGNRKEALFSVALIGLSGIFELAALSMVAPILSLGLAENHMQGVGGAFFREFGPGGRLGAPWLQFVLVVGAGVSSGIVRWRSTKALLALRFGIEMDLRKQLTERLLTMNWRHFHLMRGGSISNSMLTAVWHIGEGVDRYIFAAGTLTIVFVLFAGAAAVSPPLFGIAAAYAAVVAVASWAISRFASRWMRRLSSRSEDLAVLAQQTVDNAKYIRVSGLHQWARQILDASFSEYRQAVTQQFRWGELNRLSVEAIGVVFVGILLLAFRTVESGNVATFIAFTAIFYRSLPRMMVLESCRYIVRSKVAWLESWENLNRRTAVDAPAPRSVAAVSSVQVEFRRNIAFCNVTFSYADESGEPLPPIFNRFSLEIPKGHFLAVIGASGSGKSTLMDLLLGLISPQSGEIAVDGVSLTAIDLDTWHHEIGYLPQEPFLVAASIATNVAFGDDHPDRAKIEACLRTAQAWDFVSAMPEGIDATVGERGGRLSGGQKQRLALARALYRDPSILLLDEPTSALDAGSTAKLRQVLADLKGELTVIMITHQVDLLGLADETLVLGEKPRDPRLEGPSQIFVTAAGRNSGIDTDRSSTPM